MVLLPAHDKIAVVCDMPQLAPEIANRLPNSAPLQSAAAALWIEPLANNWAERLNTISGELAPGASLIIVASGPLARLLPERKEWSGVPLGISPNGLNTLKKALGQHGFRLSAAYGSHSARSILYGLISAQFNRLGRPELADRWRFAARLSYSRRGFAPHLATVALLVARKERR